MWNILVYPDWMLFGPVFWRHVLHRLIHTVGRTGLHQVVLTSCNKGFAPSSHICWMFWFHCSYVFILHISYITWYNIVYTHICTCLSMCIYIYKKTYICIIYNIYIYIYDYDWLCVYTWLCMYVNTWLCVQIYRCINKLIYT